MTPDPSGSSGGSSNPQSWNRYAYVSGDPVNFRDPRGLMEEEVCGGEDGDPCDDGGGGGGFGGCDASQENCDIPCVGADGFTPSPSPYCQVQGGEPPPAPAPQPSPTQLQTLPPIYCEPNVIAAMKVAWGQSGNGTAGTEAGFRIDGPPVPGLYTIVPSAYTNQRSTQTMTIAPGLTTSIFHVHPNGTNPNPSPADQAIANKYDVDIFTFSSSGLYEYFPGATKSVSLRSGMSWLLPCQTN